MADIRSLRRFKCPMAKITSSMANIRSRMAEITSRYDENSSRMAKTPRRVRMNRGSLHIVDPSTSPLLPLSFPSPYPPLTPCSPSAPPLLALPQRAGDYRAQSEPTGQPRVAYDAVRSSNIDSKVSIASMNSNSSPAFPRLHLPPIEAPTTTDCRPAPLWQRRNTETVPERHGVLGTTGTTAGATRRKMNFSWRIFDLLWR
jgi:hypothetical protein